MLQVARDSGLSDIISEDITNPIVSEYPIEGSVVTNKFYLFNDDATKEYRNINLSAVGEGNEIWKFM